MSPSSTTGAPPAPSAAGGDSQRPERRVARLRAWLRRVDTHPRLIAAAKGVRERLPGDSRYGDPLSIAGESAPQLLGRQIAALSGERPSAVREICFGGLQLWQDLAEAQGRGYGREELAIMFTDLVAFSPWALRAGDWYALELLREVDRVLTSAITSHGGRVIKRLGDGSMAVFASPQQAVDAAHEACGAVARVTVQGYHPELRVGIHQGRPRKLGGDYFGVDVNIAARIAAAAGGGEVLISEATRASLDGDRVNVRRRADFRAEGTPEDLQAYVAEPA